MKNVRLNKVAELDKVVMLSGALGPNYTPGNEVLTPTALASLLVVTSEKMKAVNSANEVVSVLQKQRQISFKGIPNLAARIVQLVMSSEASEAEQLRTREIRRKYFNQTYVPASKAKDVTDPESTDATKSPRSNYRDFAGQLGGLGLLIEMVSTIGSYKSVEPAYTIEGLRQTFADLQALHAAVIKSQLDLAKAREERDALIGSTVTKTVKAFKSYMRGKFGFDGRMLHQI